MNAVLLSGFIFFLLLQNHFLGNRMLILPKPGFVTGVAYRNSVCIMFLVFYGNRGPGIFAAKSVANVTFDRRVQGTFLQTFAARKTMFVDLCFAERRRITTGRAKKVQLVVKLK